MDYDKIHEITKIDEWFIDKLAIIVEMEAALKNEPLTVELLKEAKRIEFPDKVIAELTGKIRRRYQRDALQKRYHRSVQDGRYLCGRV